MSEKCEACNGTGREPEPLGVAEARKARAWAKCKQWAEMGHAPNIVLGLCDIIDQLQPGASDE